MLVTTEMPLKVLPASNQCEACQYRTLRLFCNLTPAALAAFGALGAGVRFGRGATLYRETEPSAGVFVLCTGQAKLSCMSPAGKTMILKIAGPGDVLGLSAVLGNLPYEVTAETIEPVELRHIPRKDFLAFLDQFGEASLHAAQAMQSEYRDAFLEARLLSLSTTAAGRLARVLLKWGGHVACAPEHLASSAKAKPLAAQIRFNMALTHEELGSMANLSRETVTRVLTRLQRDKLLAVRGATMVLLDPDRLQALAEQ